MVTVCQKSKSEQDSVSLSLKDNCLGKLFFMLQTLLEEFGAVVYADVTTRFKSSNSLNFVRARGRNDFLVWDTPLFTSVAAYTNKPTFLFFNESRCLFTEAGMIDSQVKTWFWSMWSRCII